MPTPQPPRTNDQKLSFRTAMCECPVATECCHRSARNCVFQSCCQTNCPCVPTAQSHAMVGHWQIRTMLGHHRVLGSYSILTYHHGKHLPDGQLYCMLLNLCQRYACIRGRATSSLHALHKEPHERRRRQWLYCANICKQTGRSAMTCLPNFQSNVATLVACPELRTHLNKTSCASLLPHTTSIRDVCCIAL